MQQGNAFVSTKVQQATVFVTLRVRLLGLLSTRRNTLPFATKHIRESPRVEVSTAWCGRSPVVRCHRYKPVFSDDLSEFTHLTLLEARLSSGDDHVSSPCGHAPGTLMGYALLSNT